MSASGTVVIQNPKSGSGDHADTVADRVASQGYELEQTESEGDAVTLATEAVNAGFDTLVAAGGDGTINEVVRGIDQAGGFEDVTLGVLPLGTGNNFATQIGIPDIDTAFEVLRDGERRRIDLGRAEGRPFVNSCIAGLTAESSGDTSSEMKNRLGMVAYVLTTLRSVSDFEALRLTIEGEEIDETPSGWTGEALGVLIGNGRRFTTEGGSQADMEDGRFDIVVIKDVSAVDLMSDHVIERLFDRESDHIVRAQTPELTVTVHNPEAVRFSLDGEIMQTRKVTLDVQPRTLSLAVGDAYDPSPE